MKGNPEKIPPLQTKNPVKHALHLITARPALPDKHPRSKRCDFTIVVASARPSQRRFFAAGKSADDTAPGGQETMELAECKQQEHVTVSHVQNNSISGQAWRTQRKAPECLAQGVVKNQQNSQ